MYLVRLLLGLGLALSTSIHGFGQEKGEGEKTKSSEQLREEARAHFGAGRFPEAWKAFEAAIEGSPSDPELLNEYAWNLVTFKGKSPETAKKALPHARKAVELAPRHGGIIDTLAEVYFVLGETRKALAWNEVCREHSRMTTFFDQLVKYARRYVKELGTDEGRKKDRAQARAWLAEGLLGKRRREAKEAEILAREALALDPANAEAPRLLARSLFYQKKYREAVGAFRKALAVPGGTEDARVLFGLGYALVEAGGGQGKAAVDLLKKALALDPGLRGARRTLARAYLAAGDPDAALAEAQLAAARIRNRWQPEFDREPLLILMGRAWEKKGNHGWAMEFFLQALLTRGHDAEAKAGLERTYGKVFLEGPPPREYFAARDRVTTPFFDDATGAWGLGKASGRRVAFGDVDGDGLDDLLFGGCRLWRNREGRFEDAKDDFPEARGRGGVFADVDNDGDLDAFMAGAGKKGPAGDALFLNDGEGKFTRREGAGVSDDHPTEGAAFADYDADGNVDLYVANYEGPMSAGHPDFLYRGLGDGSFEDATRAAGIERKSLRCGRGVVWGDVDGDGDPDLHVSNYRLNPNFLFLNQGDATFEEVAEARGVRGVPIRGYYGHTIGSVFGDVDNDGDLDLFQANLAHPRFIEFSDQSFLLMNGGAPGFAFTDRRRASGIRFEETHSDPLFADFDNDGHLDLYVTSVYEGRKSFLYRNRGDGSFQDVTWFAGVRADNGWGCAASDVEGDGDLDLVVCASGGPRLFLNRGNGNHWLQVHVVGTQKA
ncbi:MAG: FG-GAP-like repeat-containing protein, partial [Planctomycetota bacterium]